MSTNSAVKKSTETPTNTEGYVGKDQMGFDHVWCKDEGRVVRLDETGIERSTDLDGHGITEYRRTVETQVGWATRDTVLAVDFADHLGDF